MNRLEQVLNNEEVIIYGVNKYQQDFEYVFDYVKVKIYISEDGSTAKGDKSVYLIDQVPIELLRSSKIIVCSYKKEECKKNLENMSLKYDENFYWGEDFFPLLNDKDENGELQNVAPDRQIVAWGTGRLALELFKNGVEFENRKICCFIDSDVKKRKTKFLALDIISPEEYIEKYENAFCFITMDAWIEAEEFLEKAGKKKYIDFTHYIRGKATDLAELMRKTVFDSNEYRNVCQYPFERVVAWRNGSISCCCEGMLQPFGNILVDDVDSIWNGNEAKIIRLSIINKTYSFCDKKTCPYLQKAEKIFDQNERMEFDTIDSPQWIQLNIDYTCNLYCKSCRTHLKVAKGEEKKQIEQIADKLQNSGWLEKTDILTIAGDGEALFSQIYRRLIFDVNQKRRRIVIGTNGQLISESIILQLKELYDDVTFMVSVDGMKKETYEALRCGGNYERLIKNLKLLSKFKQEGTVTSITYTFVVQQKNYREMKALVEFAREYNVDRIVFWNIHNWGSCTEEEFNEVSMIASDGTMKTPLKQVMRDEVFWNINTKPYLNMVELKNIYQRSEH